MKVATIAFVRAEKAAAVIAWTVAMMGASATLTMLAKSIAAPVRLRARFDEMRRGGAAC